MTISQTTQELLKAAAGRGASNDPALLTRSKIRLLQNVSKLPKHGRGAPGMFVLPNEALSCVATFRVVPAILYPVWVERTENDKFVGEHFVLPDDAEKDGYRWRLPGGGMLDKEARLAGVFENVEAELDLAKTSMKVARALNADAKARMKKLGLPLFGLAYEFGSQELVNDRGQGFYGATFTFLGGPDDPDGPSEEEIIRAGALCDIVEATLAQAKQEAEDRKGAILPPRTAALAAASRPLITSGNAALKVVEAPPPVEYDGPDDDSIPF